MGGGRVRNLFFSIFKNHLILKTSRSHSQVQLLLSMKGKVLVNLPGNSALPAINRESWLSHILDSRPQRLGCYVGKLWACACRVKALQPYVSLSSCLPQISLSPPDQRGPKPCSSFFQDLMQQWLRTGAWESKEARVGF